MYLPTYHRLDNRDALYGLIDAHPLGTWVCRGADGLIANHIPFVLDRQAGPDGTLLGHVARANPVSQQWDATAASVVTFLGPQAYITPGWYPGKAEHGRVVPTWNYVATHVHGVARVIDDGERLLDVLERLTQAQEAGRPAPWRVADAPADFVRRLMEGIVGIEIPIERIEGRLKASQDEAPADRQGTVDGLRARGHNADHAVADLVENAMRNHP
ncbi:FMN-binding negative transcriptional regulator [Hydrogenophaga sp. RWCD_12]|uniref:FMN-binding negative transcriptional regulator n=1 Tax=Hydrogenophaga sp. RWCD_12 TaxID=3391190 RepID=UPI003985230D